MEEMLRRELDTQVLSPTGGGGGGCISRGVGYQTDRGVVFVKMNSESGARVMFDGELASLQAIHDTGQVRVPQPIKVLENPEGGAVLVMEYVEISSLGTHGAAKLGLQLANLHKRNADVLKMEEKGQSSVHRNQESAYVDKFGFDTVTCCGYIPQSNTWSSNWEQFFANKIEEQIQLLETKCGDRSARDLWTQLLPTLPTFFSDLDIEPALLHGDLWGGNAGQVGGEPVIFDAASFYGHSEYDLGIANMFGGFGSSFFKNYFQVLPRQPGYEQRLQLYELFHYLNHWNHFGGGYKSSALQILKSLLREKKKS